MIKVSAMIATARLGYIDSIAESLSAQTMSQDDWELILVDDFYKERHEAVQRYLTGKIRNFKHIPPREVSKYMMALVARNTGIIHCRGEIIYFMNDYSYPSPRCLERHWEVYSRHGPRVIISGPLIDAIVLSGASIWRGAPAMIVQIKDGDELIDFPSGTPPIPVPFKDGFDQLAPENFISVFKESFKPTMPKGLILDWRLGAICGKYIESNLCQNTIIDPWSWWWAGRNDSAPLEALLGINGFDENFDGAYGGGDGEAAKRLMQQSGCRYLVDTLAPCYELSHPIKKKSSISEEERDRKVEEGRKPLPNTYNLREERKLI